LPASAKTLFEAKAKKKVSFEEIAKVLNRDEVACAALFYGQGKASPDDIKNLSEYFGIDHAQLEEQMGGFPDRGKSVEMPPKEPLIYRLYEIVQNYGYAYKAVLNEKFGDGIMSAIAFSTKVEKETDKDGVVWVSFFATRAVDQIELTECRSIFTSEANGCPSPGSRPQADRVSTRNQNRFEIEVGITFQLCTSYAT